jgi:hypothetical protein
MDKLLKFIFQTGTIIGGLYFMELMSGGNTRTNPDRWIQRAIKKDPGRVRRYLKRKYGAKEAINEDGTINMKILKDAITMVGNDPRRNQNHLLDALILAKRLKEGV